MSNALVAAERFLYTTLTGDSALAALVGSRVHGHLVPPEATFPLVFYTFAAPGNDKQTIEANRVWSEFVYAVRYVNKVESYTQLEAGAAAIEDALHKKSGSNVSGMVVAAVAEDPFPLLEIDPDGSQVRHLGFRFRLYVQ